MAVQGKIGTNFPLPFLLWQAVLKLALDLSYLNDIKLATNCDKK